MATIFPVLVKIGGTAGTDCDFVALSSAATSSAATQLDLTAPSVRVYSGTRTGTMNDGAPLVLWRTGAPADPPTVATVHHAAYGGTALLLRGVTISTSPAAADEWRVSAITANYFTLSGDQSAGDSVAVRILNSTTASPDTAPAFFDWTTSGANSLEICASAGHSAGTQLSTSKYRLAPDQQVYSLYLGSACKVATIAGLQIGNAGTVSGSGTQIIDLAASGSISLNICNCFVYGNTAGSSQYGIRSMGTPSPSLGYVKIWNTIVCNCTGSGNQGIRFNGPEKQIFLGNNTIIDCTVGLRNQGSVLSASICCVNNIIQSPDAISGGFPIGDDTRCDYNAFSGTESFGGTHDKTSVTATFVNYAAGNFALSAADSVCVNFGNTVSGYMGGVFAFTTDILGITRPVGAAWDIGAHEYSASGVVTISASGTNLWSKFVQTSENYCGPAQPFCGNATAQVGTTNPPNITTLSPAFSALLNPLPGVTITSFRIQVSSADDADFSETLNWDSDWQTLVTPHSASARCEDIRYGEL